MDGSGETGGGFRGLSMGPSLTLTPTFAYPPVPPPAVSNLNDYQIQPDPRYSAGKKARDEALQKLYASYTDPAPYATVLRATSDTADATVKSLHDAAAGHQPSVTYPKGPLADGLKLLAAAIVKDVGLRAGYVIIGGFDTHADQAQHQSQLLQTLAEGVAAFQTDITAAGKADNVLLITWSEFGRRVAENAARGTDHGTARPFRDGQGGERGESWGIRRPWPTWITATCATMPTSARRTRRSWRGGLGPTPRPSWGRNSPSWDSYDTT